MTQEKVNVVVAITAEQLKALPDFQQYSKFLHTSSLKAATLFMNDALSESKNAPLNTIYRCPHYFESIHFKNVQYTTTQTAGQQNQAFPDKPNLALLRWTMSFRKIVRMIPAFYNLSECISSALSRNAK